MRFTSRVGLHGNESAIPSYMASSVWKGHLTFGLVSIPVRLLPAARAKKIPLRQVYRHPPEPTCSANARPEVDEPADYKEPPLRKPSASGFFDGPQARVHYAPSVAATSPDSPPPQIEKAYEYEKDRYVALPKETLKNLAAPTSTAVDISEFVKLDEIDPLYFEASYYVVPESGGEKPYSLLFAALRESGYVGIASIAMHRREHTVILRPGNRGLILHTMFYEDEVRTQQEFIVEADANPKELQMATMLINAMASHFDPKKFKDPYREKLQVLIDLRLENAPPAALPATAASTPVVDIMEALKQSLSRLKKPADAAQSADPAAARSHRKSSRKAG